MSARHWIVTAAVAVVCTSILVLFTEVEETAVKWVNCGPLASAGERANRGLCR
jgi:hypothetical protein